MRNIENASNPDRSGFDLLLGKVMPKKYEQITSRANRAVTVAASLAEKKYRDELSLFLCEGVKLFREAVNAGADIERVFVTPRTAEDPEISALLDRLPERSVAIVSDSVLERISTEKSPQGIICTVRYLDKTHKNNTIYNNPSGAPRRAILLDCVSDPGNVGTVLRTAAAFGIELLILGPGCADIYNPRAVRASMGAIFRQKTVRVTDLAASVTALRDSGAEVWAATLDAELTISELAAAAKDKSVSVIIGNEGHGISHEVEAAATGKVNIPITGDAESLNAAIAAAVFMWELRTYR